MIFIEGQYGKAYLTTAIGPKLERQIRSMLSSPAIDGRVVIMPDAHPGVGAVVGFTMPYSGGKIIPSIIGVDIGCGVSMYRFQRPVNLSCSEIDKRIRGVIPLGFEHRSKALPNKRMSQYQDLARRVNGKSPGPSLGTLGGGNHFIELGRMEKGTDVYLTIHTGSRRLGLDVANYYIRMSRQTVSSQSLAQYRAAVQQAKRENQGSLIQKKVQEARAEYLKSRCVNKDLCYLEGAQARAYMRDMYIAQRFARDNREAIAKQIMEVLNLPAILVAESVHNFISPRDNIIRKGAIAAHKGQRLVIPINRTFGTIIATGRGNVEWNYSAPHGAGRAMGRREAKGRITQQQADHVMQEKGVYSSYNPIDESDAAYKSPNLIMTAIEQTADIRRIIKPFLNIKG